MICNHTSWLDIFVNMSIYLPSFVARAEVKDIPLIGKFTDYLESVYVYLDKKDKSKNNTVERITEH